jgi:hypothetical protein
MAHEKKAGMIFPRGARRAPVLSIGTCVEVGGVAGVVCGVWKRLRFARRYEVQSHAFGFAWVRRDEIAVVPCQGE